MNVIAPISINTDTQLVSSNIPETDYADYAAGTTYAAGAKVQVTTSGVHKCYESAVAGNVGHNPPDNIYDDTVDPATGYWIDLGATNRWAMFDGLSRKSSSLADQIVVVLTPGQLFNNLALVNIEAADVTVLVTDPEDGQVYFARPNVVDLYDVTDFYSWFFFEPRRKQTIVLSDLPASPSGTVTINLSAPGETVEAGEIVLGKEKYIGRLLYGYKAGMKDWSTKDEDKNGNPIFTQGKYSDTVSFPIRMNRSTVYDVRRTLAEYRGGRALLWVGNEELQETIVYARFEDFAIEIQTSRYAYGTIDTEELS